MSKPPPPPRKVMWPLQPGWYLVTNTSRLTDETVYRVVEVVIHTESGYHQAGRWLGPGTFYWETGVQWLRGIETMESWPDLRFVPLDLPALAAAYREPSPV